MKSSIDVQGHEVTISHPDKILYHQLEINKAEYIQFLISISPYFLAHTTDKALTTLRYPHGVGDEFFYQKRPPKKAPEWVDIVFVGEDDFVNLNKLPTLVWMANLTAMEFHTPFCNYNEDATHALVFDLDPSEGQSFDDVAECAVKINDTLVSLGITALAKTSGATGLQIYIPTKTYTFEQGRELNEFFAKYFVSKYPDIMTIERLVKNRGKKLYFDYLQMWRGKSIISVYSPRAMETGAVSMPVTWDEIKNGIKPKDLNITNAAERLHQKGDMFEDILKPKAADPILDEILNQSKQ